MSENKLPIGTEFWHVKVPGPIQMISGETTIQAPPLPICGDPACDSTGFVLAGEQTQDDDGNTLPKPLPLYRCDNGHYTVIEQIAPYPTFEFNEDGSFSHDDWQSFWNSLSEAQRDRIRTKAAYEACSLSAVLGDWPNILEGVSVE